MSVIIKDMNMPTTPEKCPFYEVVLFRPYPCCKVYIGGNCHFPYNCPLVGIPAPHGRLVDADDVYHVLTSYYHHSTDFQHEALKESLARVSTIIEAEDGDGNV